MDFVKETTTDIVTATEHRRRDDRKKKRKVTGEKVFAYFAVIIPILGFVIFSGFPIAISFISKVAGGIVLNVGGDDQYAIRIIQGKIQITDVWQETALAEKYKALFAGEGLPVVVEYNTVDGMCRIYLEDGVSVEKVLEYDFSFADTAVNGFTVVGWDGADDSSWDYQNSQSYTIRNIEFLNASGIEEYYKSKYANVVPVVTVDESMAEVVGLSGSYAYGDTIRFTVSAKEGYVVASVTYNGQAITGDGEGNYEVVCGFKAEIVVL